MVDPTSPQPELEPLNRTQILIAMGLTAVLWLILAKVWLRTPFAGGQLPLTWNPQDVGMGLALGCAITGISALLYGVWPTYRRASDLYLALVLSPLVLGDIFWLGLLPGLSEELLFRGVLLPTLGLDWLGILGSAVCFGILHFSGRQYWPYALWATLVGIMFGYTAVASHNLLLPVVAHTVTNWTAAMIWKWRSPHNT